MKRFLIHYKEINEGIVEVFAESESEARQIAEIEGMRMDSCSTMTLGELESEEDIEDY